MKPLAYWEELERKLVRELSAIPHPVIPRLLVRGLRRGLRAKMRFHHRALRERRMPVLKRRRKLKSRLCYARERIAAIRARTVYDRLRQGGLEV